MRRSRRARPAPWASPPGWATAASRPRRGRRGSAAPAGPASAHACPNSSPPPVRRRSGHASATGTGRPPRATRARPASGRRRCACSRVRRSQRRRSRPASPRRARRTRKAGCPCGPCPHWRPRGSSRTAGPGLRRVRRSMAGSGRRRSACRACLGVLWPACSDAARCGTRTNSVRRGGPIAANRPTAMRC
ncbi:hypothetical protein D9M68_630420 [compost metagenome]